MTWHADAGVIRRYLAGDTDLTSAMSIEAHLTACGTCQALLPDDPVWLEDNWSAVADSVVVARRGHVERLLVVIGVTAARARLLAATPALRRSWWAAVAAVLVFAVATAHVAADSDRALLFFLVVAPLLPVAGVALAYGPGVDPLHETVVAAPVSGLRLLLIRAVAVLCATVAMTLLAVPLLPAWSWTAVGWLLPALALTGATLVLESWLSPARASGVAAVAWLTVVVLASVPGPDALVLFRPGSQVWFAAAVAVAAVLLAARRRSFDEGSIR